MRIEIVGDTIEADGEPVADLRPFKRLGRPGPPASVLTDFRELFGGLTSEDLDYELGHEKGYDEGYEKGEAAGYDKGYADAEAGRPRGRGTTA